MALAYWLLAALALGRGAVGVAGSLYDDYDSYTRTYDYKNSVLDSTASSEIRFSASELPAPPLPSGRLLLCAFSCTRKVPTYHIFRREHSQSCLCSNSPSDPLPVLITHISLGGSGRVKAAIFVIERNVIIDCNENVYISMEYKTKPDA
ncbi:hypothetical protein EVAR_97907_1 [Eumeta japonica]|uniref:Uncharacterized protein n=1 Tax=Eumeta variegata TaxID=151549 RepID=A0A4C1WGY1_EUMVA|nr:hypothetical protein EVAR_97907_1 [Eumeta japonica]